MTSLTRAAAAAMRTNRRPLFKTFHDFWKIAQELRCERHADHIHVGCDACRLEKTLEDLRVSHNLLEHLFDAMLERGPAPEAES